MPKRHAISPPMRRCLYILAGVRRQCQLLTDQCCGLVHHCASRRWTRRASHPSGVHRLLADDELVDELKVGHLLHAQRAEDLLHDGVLQWGTRQLLSRRTATVSPHVVRLLEAGPVPP